MKKLFVLLLLGGLGYGAYYWWSHRAPEKRACARLTELCGDKNQAAQCERDMSELAKQAKPETMSKLDTCLGDAKTCAEGAGCVFGTGVNVFGDALGQFMKGVGGALNK
jgi:hypothetical protein